MNTGIEEETPQYILLFFNDVDTGDSSPVEPTHQPFLAKGPRQEFRFQLPCIEPAIQQDPNHLAFVAIKNAKDGTIVCALRYLKNKPHWMHLPKALSIGSNCMQHASL